MTGRQRLHFYLIWRGSMSVIALLSLLMVLSAVADLLAPR